MRESGAQDYRPQKYSRQWTVAGTSHWDRQNAQEGGKEYKDRRPQARWYPWASRGAKSLGQAKCMKGRHESAPGLNYIQIKELSQRCGGGSRRASKQLTGASQNAWEGCTECKDRRPEAEEYPWTLWGAKPKPLGQAKYMRGVRESAHCASFTAMWRHAAASRETIKTGLPLTR